MVNHVDYTKFTIFISCLFPYYVILNNPVTGLIIIIDLIFKIYGSPFLCMKHERIISTHSLFHGIYSSFLDGNLPFYLAILYAGNCQNYLLTSWWHF